MTGNSSKRLANASGWFWLAPLAAFGLAACAAKPPAVVEVKKDPGDDRIFLLQQKLEEKESELEKLAAKMDALQAKAEMEKQTGDSDTVAMNKLPRVKLTPEISSAKKNEIAQAEKEESEALVGHDEAVSLADSRHETMHWYFRGLTLVEKKMYEEAIEAFTTFLKSSPRHVYADRAQYWLGEANYRAKDFAMALIAFNRLEGEYPESFRRVEAGYKKGLCLEKAGRLEDAVLQLKELVRRFPRHPLTSEASTRLASLEVDLSRKQLQ